MVTFSLVGCSASFRSVSLDILLCICIRGRILPDGALAVLIDLPVRWSALGRLLHLSVGCELSLSLTVGPRPHVRGHLLGCVQLECPWVALG